MAFTESVPEVGPTDNIIGTLTTALRNAPELSTSPGLAVPAAQSPDPAGTAQALANQTNNLALQRAVNRTPAHRSFFGQLTHDLGVGFHDVTSLLNKPLQLAQHEYRYLHDVEARHGTGALLEALLPTLAAGAATGIGVAAAPFTGGASLAVGAGISAGILGTEVATAGEGQILHHDSWQRTTNGASYTDPHTGQPVSLGRDFASSVLGLKPGTGTFKWVSGFGDALGDLALDPLARAGSTYALANKARFTVTNAADVDKLARTSHAYQRFADDVARSDTGTIMRNYRRLVAEQTPRVDSAGNVIAWEQSHDLAALLGAATTRDEVTQIFKEYAEAQNLTYGRLPTLHISLTTIPTRAARDFLADAPITRRFMAGQQRLQTEFDPETGELSNKQVDPMSPQFGPAVYTWARGNGQTERVARTWANNIINTDDLQNRLEAWKNLMQLTLVAQAHRDGMPLGESAMLLNPANQQRLGQEMQYLTSGIGPGRDTVYGFGPPNALHIPGVKTTEDTSFNAAILLHQTGKVSFPSMTEMRMASSRLMGGLEAVGTFRGLLGATAQRSYLEAQLARAATPAERATLQRSLDQISRTTGKAQQLMSLAKIDEWTAEHVTRNLFKTWVLLNAVFPLHVVLSEGVLGALRLGTANLLRSKLAVSYGRLSAKYGGVDDAVTEALKSPLALRSIGALSYHLLGPLMQNSERAEWALKSIIHNTDNAVVSPALTADHSMPYAREEHYSSILRNGIHVQEKQRQTDNFGGIGAESKDQPLAWRTWLGTITRDPPSAVAARAYKAALDRGATPEAAHLAGVEQTKFWLEDHPELHHIYHNARLVTPGWEHMSPLDAWANKIMLNVRGATTGAANTVHNDLLDAIVNGHFRPREGAPNLPDHINQKYLSAIEDKPALTHGRLKEPDPTSLPARIAEIGYSKIVSPIINKWSREPIYNEISFRFYKQLQPAVQDGRISEEEAFIKAHIWANHDMLRFVHNLHERTFLSETLRNLAPFWFAQQQAYKRVGRLLAENPGAFRKYQLLVTGMQDYAIHAKDAGGNNTVAFPGSGFIGAGVPALLNTLGMNLLNTNPVSFSGSLESMSFILPGATGLPGTHGHPIMDFGPLVAIPVHQIANLFPELTPAATTLLGDIPMSEPIWRQMIPSATANRVIDALTQNSRGFMSSLMSTMQTLDYEQWQAEKAWEAGGRKGPEPSIAPGPGSTDMERQQWINRVKNTTRIQYLTKALLGFFSPLSPSLAVNDFGFKKALHDSAKAEGSYSAGLDAFLKAHPDATPFTISQSTDPSGFHLPESIAAEHWVNRNLDLITRYPQAAYWLMPQNTDETFNTAVYNEQLAQGIRVRRTPMEFQKAFYIAAGNLEFYASDRAYHQALASNQYDPAELRASFAAYTKSFGIAHPVWYDNFQSKTKTDDRLQAIDQLTKILSAPRPPRSPMVGPLRGLLSDYANFNTAVANQTDTHAALSESFQAYLISVFEAHPELKPFIVSVLGPLTDTRGASFTQAEQAAGITNG